jgi:hypothetical protein
MRFLSQTEVLLMMINPLGCGTVAGRIGPKLSNNHSGFTTSRTVDVGLQHCVPKDLNIFATNPLKFPYIFY